MPYDLKETICNFVDLNKKQMNVHKFHPSMKANISKTLIWADMPWTITIREKGTYTILVQTTEHEKNASMCVEVEEKKLKLYNLKLSLAARPNGWMNKKLTANRKKIWLNFSFTK